MNAGAQKQPVIVRTCRCIRAQRHLCISTCSRAREREDPPAPADSLQGAAAARASRPSGGVSRTHGPTWKSSACQKDLPEYIELDLSAMNLNDTLYLTDNQVPVA